MSGDDVLLTLRVLSVVAFVFWVLGGVLCIPPLVQAHPGEHPVLILLLGVSILEIARSASQVVAAMNVDAIVIGAMSADVQISIWTLRVASLVEFLLFFVIIQRVRRG